MRLLAKLWRVWLCAILVTVALCLVGWALIEPPLITFTPAPLGRFIVQNWWLALLVAGASFYVLGLLLIAVDQAYSWSFRLLWVATGVLSWSFLPAIPIAYWLCFVERPRRFGPRSPS